MVMSGELVVSPAILVRVELFSTSKSVDLVCYFFTWHMCGDLSAIKGGEH